jgi:hypothetical protein
MAMNVSMASSKGKQWTGDECRKKDVLRSSLPAMSNIPNIPNPSNSNGSSST